MLGPKKIFSRYPLWTRFAILFLFPIFLVWGSFLYLSKSLPQSTGQVNTTGISNEITITRGKFFIPVITAKNDNDAFFSLGYVHAQDRLWQMEMTRRFVAGRLSEVIGAKGLVTDKYTRTLGLSRGLDQMWEKLDPTAKSFITSYVNGVNASIKNYKVLPLEFIYFNLKPEPWTVYDSLSVVESMALLMSRNYQGELKRSVFIEIFGVERARDLFPNIPINDADILFSYLNTLNGNFYDLSGQHTDIAALLNTENRYTGSNNWVVSGSHTSSGLPLLANDPHLKTTIPSSWYMAAIKGHKLDISGATFPGFPFMIVGHNKNIGWGITNMQADVQDLRLERINSIQKNMYLKDGQNKKIITRREYIKVREGIFKKRIAPVPIDIRETENGPIISDVIGVDGGAVYSLTWVNKIGLSGTIDSFYKLSYAHDWNSFRESLRNYVAPAQNFVYADIKGNIGYIAPGLLPIRKKGGGMVPTPGWLSEYDWQSWIPFDELPQMYNPPSGVIVTANNKVVGDDYPYYITGDWMPSHRAKRIEYLINEVIGSGKKISADDFRRIQGDTTSLASISLLPYFSVVSPASEKQKYILDRLKKWDGNLSIDSVPASIFTVWVHNFSRLVMEDEIDSRALSPSKKVHFDNLIKDVNYAFLEQVLNGEKEKWCDYKTTDVVESCADILQVSLEHSVHELERIAGKDIDSWRWGAIHKTQYFHFPFTKSSLSTDSVSVDNRVMHFFAHNSEEAGGDENTINVAVMSGENSNKKFLQFVGATYRQILDFDNLDQSLFINTPGQSGNILSEHYNDLIQPHKNLLMLQMGNADILEKSTLLLMPIVSAKAITPY